MKKIKLALLLLCGVCMTGLTGCEDLRDEHLEDYQTMVYFRNGGLQTLRLFRVGENTIYEIPICKSGHDRSGSGSAVIAVMDQEQLDIYNMTNGTNYVQLPATYYDFRSELEFTFTSSDTYKIARVEMKTDEISALQEADPDRDYVLALQLYSDRMVSPEINLLLLSPSIGIPTIGFENTGVKSYSYTTSSPETNTYPNYVVLDMDNRWEFTCDLEVCDQAWLDAYNAENGTAYKLLPEAGYSMPTQIAFVPGTSRMRFDMTIDRTVLDLLTEYVLPVRLANCTKEQFVIDENAVFLLNVRQDPDQIPLTESMLTSPYTHTGDGGGIPHLVDGVTDAASYWHSFYGGGPIGDPIYGYYIDVKLDKPLSAVVFRYCTRSNNNATPSVIRVGASTDGQTWTLLGEIATGLPTGALEWASLPVFSSTQSFAYVRFGIAQSAGAAGGDLTVQVETGACTALSELELYGANVVD